MAGSRFTMLSKTGIRGDEQEKVTKDLLLDATVIGIDTTESGACLNSVALRLKDGRVCMLTEECAAGWSGSVWGWINIEVDGKEYP